MSSLFYNRIGSIVSIHSVLLDQWPANAFQSVSKRPRQGAKFFPLVILVLLTKMFREYPPCPRITLFLECCVGLVEARMNMSACLETSVIRNFPCLTDSDESKFEVWSPSTRYHSMQNIKHYSKKNKIFFFYITKKNPTTTHVR